jgi:hypothetical protein
MHRGELIPSWWNDRQKIISELSTGTSVIVMLKYSVFAISASLPEKVYIGMGIHFGYFYI